MDKWYLLKCAAILLLVDALCILMALHEGPRDTAFKDAVIVVALVLPLSVFLLFFLSFLLVAGPAVEITEQGITWNVSWVFRGSLPWSQVKSVACVKVGSLWYVKLEPDDMHAYVASQPWPRRMLWRAMLGRNWVVTPTCFPGAGLRNGSAGSIAKVARRCVRAAGRGALRPAPIVVAV